MNDIIKAIENEQLKSDITDFNVGDTVKVYAKNLRLNNRENTTPWKESEITYSAFLNNPIHSAGPTVISQRHFSRPTSGNGMYTMRYPVSFLRRLAKFTISGLIPS